MEDEVRRELLALLKSLRAGTYHYKGFLERLRRDLRNHKLTPSDIGTSKEELEELRVLGCKTAAQVHLDCLRLGSVLYKDHLSKLRAELNVGGLELDAIGTSAEEVEKLRVLGCLKTARKWLDHLKGCPSCDINQRILFRKRLYAELKEADRLPEDIGTTNAELNTLVNKRHG